MENKKDHPISWLNLMLTEPFYLFHFLAFFSYFVSRVSTSQSLSSDLSTRLLRREIQAFLAFLVLAVVKLVKDETWEAFIADILLFAKGLLIAVIFIIDHHLAFCYMVGFLVIYILTQQPPYEGLGNSSYLTPLQLETLLTEGNASRFWLVEFRALCSSACIRTSSFLPDLSITYSNKNVSFGRVDLGRFPNVAEKFGISMNGQLPTYILFDNAVEVARCPELDFQANASKLTKGLLCRHFELDRHLLEYVSGK